MNWVTKISLKPVTDEACVSTPQDHIVGGGMRFHQNSSTDPVCWHRQNEVPRIR